MCGRIQTYDFDTLFFLLDNHILDSCFLFFYFYIFGDEDLQLLSLFPVLFTVFGRFY